ERFFRFFSLGDVDARAYIPEELVGHGELGSSDIDNPAILSVGAQKLVFHCELFAPVERVGVDLKASREVLRVHSLGPAVSDLLFHGSPGEIEPLPVKVVAELVDA